MTQVLHPMKAPYLMREDGTVVELSGEEAERIERDKKREARLAMRDLAEDLGLYEL